MSSRPFRMSGTGGRHSQMSGVVGDRTGCPEWSGSHPSCLGVVGRPSQFSGSGQ